MAGRDGVGPHPTCSASLTHQAGSTIPCAGGRVAALPPPPPQTPPSPFLRRVHSLSRPPCPAAGRWRGSCSWTPTGSWRWGPCSAALRIRRPRPPATAPPPGPRRPCPPPLPTVPHIPPYQPRCPSHSRVPGGGGQSAFFRQEYGCVGTASSLPMPPERQFRFHSDRSGRHSTETFVWVRVLNRLNPPYPRLSHGLHPSGGTAVSPVFTPPARKADGIRIPPPRWRHVYIRFSSSFAHSSF